MNVGYFLLCLILMLPLAGLTLFGALIESFVKLGFWTTLELIFATIFDPMGKGIWGIMILFSVAGVVAAGFSAKTRPAGFALVSVLSIAAYAFIYYAFPADRDWGVLWVLSPSIAGSVLSAYCAAKSFQAIVRQKI
jgi:hypothetical protein